MTGTPASPNSEKPTFWLKFWGVRGSIATPGPQNVRYGGNTSCVEVQCGDRKLILDCGTGMRELGLKLREAGPQNGDVLLTHTHVDHIVGLPFFGPFFDKRNTYRIWCGHLAPSTSFRKVLSDFMTAPLFPVPPEIFDAHLTFNEFEAGSLLDFGDGITVQTALLNHPQGATGYRINYAGKSICYCTDTEHKGAERDPNIMALIEGSDMLIYDATYTDEEYPRYKGWGHSTWQEAVRLADAAHVKRVVLFHHDPSHDDDFMDKIAQTVSELRPGTVVSREGLWIEP